MKKTIKDILYNAIYQLFLIILPLLTTPILSRRIGADGLGVYGYVFSMAQFLMTVIAIGMNPFRIRNVAKVRKNKHELSLQFWNIYLMQFLIGIIAIILYVGSVFLLKLDYTNLYLIQIIFIAGLTLDISWFFQGIEEFSKVVIRNTLIKLSSVVLIVLFVWTRQDLWIYVLITSLANFIGSLVFWINIKNKVESPTLNIPLFKSLWRPGLMILIPQLFMQVYTTLDKTVVGHFVSPTQLSYYDQSQKIARIILALLTSITIVMLPKLTGALADGNKEGVIHYTKKSFDYTLIISVVLFTIVFLNTKNFVPWFFGVEFKPMIDNMLIVGGIIIVSPIGGVFSNQFSIAIEKDKAFAYPLIIGAIISVVGNVLIVPHFSSLGGTIVLVLVETLVCFLKIYFVKDELNLRIIFSKNVLIFLLAGAVINLLTFFVPTLFASAFLDMAFKSIILIIIFIPIVFLTFPEIRLELTSNFSKIRR